VVRVQKLVLTERKKRPDGASQNGSRAGKF
jgi:hypothetical protein